MGEPGPPGSPISDATPRRDTVATLYELIDTLIGLSNAGPTAQRAAPQRDLPLLLDAAAAATLLSLSRAKVCDMASRGEIPIVRIGRSVRIPRDLLLAWIDHRTSAASSPAAVRLPNWAHGNRSGEL